MTGSWVWAGARAVGTSHIGAGVPCQDAFACRIWQRGKAPPVLIAALADGAGSAGRAEIGSAIAVSTLVEIMDEELTDDCDAGLLADLLRHAVGEIQMALDLQARHDGRDRCDYASTLLVAVLHNAGGVIGQIGDGAVVIQDTDGGWRPVHWPDHGEYANTTRFLTETDALDALQIAVLPSTPRRVCLFSDGLERLLLDFRQRSAHAPFFDSVFARFDPLATSGHAAEVSRDLAALLASDKVNSRTDDDKSLVCAAWRGD